MTPSGKDPAKSKKLRRASTLPKTKGKALTNSPPAIIPEGADDRRAARNVAHIRAKLTAAIADPKMRDQIVRAMRSFIYEDEK